MKDRMVWRSRWAALGAAVAISIGGGGVFLASAAPGPAESTIVNVTPVRVLDTRDPVNVGLPGPFVSAVSQKLQITGAVPTTAGTQSPVPTGATGVLLNVTSVGPTANGFISVRPGDATGAPATSSLNVNAGSNVPNAVQVALPTAGANAGKIDITWDAYGVAGPTTEILVDIVGYTTSKGIQELVADVVNLNTVVGTKANAADVYTKAQVNAGFVPQGEIVMSDYPLFEPNNNVPPTAIQYFSDTVRVTGGVGFAHMGLTGPRRLGAVNYGLKSMTYCLRGGGAPAFITSFQVTGWSAAGVSDTATDGTDRSAAGCYTLNVNDPVSQSYQAMWTFSGAGGFVDFLSVTTTWAPTTTLEADASIGTPDSSDGSSSG